MPRNRKKLFKKKRGGEERTLNEIAFLFVRCGFMRLKRKKKYFGLFFDYSGYVIFPQ